MSFSIHQIYHQIFRVWREQRFRNFLDTMAPTRDRSLLDVGGYPGFWLGKPRLFKSIDTLNLTPAPISEASALAYNIRSHVGDGRRLPFPDQSFDIVFSNSVIEHVGSSEDQARFAREIRRVGRALWVQTPAFECPIEPHYLAPFVHYLPKTLQRKLVRWLTPWGWLQKPSPSEVNAMIEEILLLKYQEFAILFPDCEIRTEPLCRIMRKSFIAVKIPRIQDTAIH